MSAPAALVLGFGVGVLVGAPLVAPLALWLLERSMRRRA